MQNFQKIFFKNLKHETCSDEWCFIRIKVFQKKKFFFCYKKTIAVLSKFVFKMKNDFFKYKFLHFVFLVFIQQNLPNLP